MENKTRKPFYFVAAAGLVLTSFSGARVQAEQGPFARLLTSVDDGSAHIASDARYTNDDILKGSQISYRADGGFTGVQGYGVIISCVNGKISVLKTISDPRLRDEAATVHDISSIGTDEYLNLWDNLDREALFKMSDAPDPKVDILDEFTVTFHAVVGKDHHEFRVHGISRPEAARYYALRQLIDDSVHMKALWNVHSDLARLDQDSIAEK
jgi:hypothetical protein